MCTVTYIPRGNTFHLTSNRDEHSMRLPALPPDIYRINGRKILFPKDGQAGGTWFAVNESGCAVVFLNGGLKNHVHQSPYRKSRGLILLDLIAAASPSLAFGEMGFEHIEPFTAIIAERQQLFHCIWDGFAKSMRETDPGLPHIWSSVTLYERATINKRQDWFNTWISKNPDPSLKEIMWFHQSAGDGDPNNDILMNREDKLFTNSISSARISGKAVDFHYLDLRFMQTTDHSMNFLKPALVNP